MYQKRNKKLVKRGSSRTLLREARRRQRLQLAAGRSSGIKIITPCTPPVVDKKVQCRVMLELAWKTISLMHKNRLIQQKIIALQKETSDFIERVLSNPENNRQYQEYLRLNGLRPEQGLPPYFNMHFKHPGNF